jgi:hypothetical protein
MIIKKLLKIEIVLVIAIVIRILWACLVMVEPVSDSVMYDKFAMSISSGHGYAYPDGSLTAYWPVGTSAVYAFLYLLFGKSYLPIVILNIVIGTSIVWFIYAIALRNFGQRTAIISALIVCLWPLLIQFTTILASELLFIFLLLFAIFIWGHQKIPVVPRAVAWGALICAASFIRPIAYPLLVIFPVLNWIKTRNLRISFISLIAGVLTASILFSPWVYRNYKLFNGFVLIAANDGVNLWMGNNPESDGSYMSAPRDLSQNELERNNYLKAEAVSYILKNPVDYVKLSIKRFFITYKSETIGIHWNLSYLEKVVDSRVITAMKLISTVYWWMILLLGIVGIYLFIRKKKLEIFNPFTVIIVYFFMIPILTVGQDRYHMPIMPFFAIFFAYAVEYYITKSRVGRIITKN